MITLHSQGMLSSAGKMLLFADADGATTFEDFQKLESSIYEMSKRNGRFSLSDCDFIMPLLL